MKTKSFILSLTALAFSTICNAQEYDLFETQIDTTQTGFVMHVEPRDSTYWMVSSNPPYIIDSNIVDEPQIAICGGIFPFEPDSMNYKYSGYDTTEFYWSKDKFNQPYYYLQVATDSVFNNIVYSSNSIVGHKLIVVNQPFIKAQFYVMDDTTSQLRAPNGYYWRVGVDTQGWGLYFNEPNGQNITWSKTDIYMPPTFYKCIEPISFPLYHVYPNPAIDEINVAALQGDFIELLDANGSILVTTYGTEVSTNVINISQLKSGNYFLKITSGREVKTSRIIKQ